MTKLKECPFCGSTDLNTSYINAIYCKGCEGGVDLGDHGGKTQQFTIDAWNHRTSIPISKIEELIKGYETIEHLNKFTVKKDLQKLMDEYKQ